MGACVLRDGCPLIEDVGGKQRLGEESGPRRSALRNKGVAESAEIGKSEISFHG